MVVKVIMLFLAFTFAIPLLGQVRSPRQAFEIKMLQRYGKTHERAELDVFLELPWGTEQHRRAEKVLGANAIQMAKLFGDYSGLLSTPDEELASIGERSINVLGIQFSDFWNKLHPDTKQLLFANPAFFVRAVEILEGFEKTANSHRYKRLLADTPDLLVFLHRFPSMLEISEDRLTILAHFLQHVDMSQAKADELSNLDNFLATWNQQLLAIYVANAERGVAPALTMWAMPDFFRNSGGDLEGDMAYNQRMWELVIGQIGFLIERRRDALDWDFERRAIADLFGRRPTNHQSLNNDDWMEFLLRTGGANGDALRRIWELRRDEKKLARIDELLAYFKERKIPFSIMLSLLKFATTGEELYFLADFSLNTLYHVGIDEARKSPTLGLPAPIMVMSELERDNDFVLLLRLHNHKLITYLYDQAGGGSVNERYKLAINTQLRDVEYDESAMRQILKIAPGGNIVNVAIKSFNGYPVSNLEYVMAAVDVGRVALTVATLGGSEAIGTAGGAATAAAGTAAEAAVETAVVTAAGTAAEAAVETAVVTAAVEIAAEAVIEQTAEAAATSIFWNSVQELAKTAIQKGGMWAAELTIEQIAESFIDKYNQAASERERLELARKHLVDVRREGNLNLDVEAQKRLGVLPLRQSAARQVLLFDSIGGRVTVSLPEVNREWFLAFEGKTEINQILLVTLGDLL